MLRFRNITATPNDPVERWGSDGIVTALERGSLQHWNRIAVAAVDPKSKVASQVESAFKICQSKAAIIWTRERIAELRATPEERVARELHTLRMSSGLTQAEFAQRLETSASRLSTYISGQVTPSAAFMVRARDFSELARRENFKDYWHAKKGSTNSDR